MTTGQIIACAIAWTAAIVAITAFIPTRVTQRRAATRWHIRYPVQRLDGYGYLTTQKPLAQSEFEALKAAWERRYGPGRPVLITENGDAEEESGA